MRVKKVILPLPAYVDALLYCLSYDDKLNTYVNEYKEACPTLSAGKQMIRIDILHGAIYSSYRTFIKGCGLFETGASE